MPQYNLLNKLFERLNMEKMISFSIINDLFVPKHVYLIFDYSLPTPLTTEAKLSNLN